MKFPDEANRVMGVPEWVSLRSGDRTSLAELAALSPAQLIGRLRWSRTCAEAVRRAAARDGFDAFWTVWTERLPAERRWPSAERRQDRSWVLLSSRSLARLWELEAASVAGSPSPQDAAPDLKRGTRPGGTVPLESFAWLDAAECLFAEAVRFRQQGRRRSPLKRRKTVARRFVPLVADGTESPTDGPAADPHV
ncbi:MAG: hypothetical protein D6725_11040, partial [Planctomycetota bacterium]